MQVEEGTGSRQQRPHVPLLRHHILCHPALQREEFCWMGDFSSVGTALP